MPDLPRIFDIRVVDFSIIKTTKILNNTAITMLKTSNSALNESNVVKLPGPAIIGNAIGTIDAVSGTSFLYMEIPIIISRAIKKIISEPATAKELTSIPIRFRIFLPINKKAIIIPPATNEAFSDSM